MALFFTLEINSGFQMREYKVLIQINFIFYLYLNFFFLMVSRGFEFKRTDAGKENEYSFL